MTGREAVAASGPRRVVLGTKMGAHINPDLPSVRLDEPGGHQRALEHALAILRIESVKLGLVLDKESVVNEGVLASLFGGGRMIRYTAYAYPHDALPPGRSGDDGLTDHCGCCAHRRAPGGCGGPDCPCDVPQVDPRN